MTTPPSPARHIDTHCHLDGLGPEVEAMLQRAAAVGVGGFILAGVRPQGWPQQRAFAAAHRGCLWTAGLHPVAAAEGGAEALDACMAALPGAFEGDHPACAVGELGLDTRFAPKDTLDIQIDAFTAQLRWAVARDAPVVIHLVGPGVFGRALAIFREIGVPSRGGVVHSYSGSADVARQMAALNLHIGIAGGVSRPQNKKLQAVIKALPGERLLIETDAPDQPLDGGPSPNEPRCVVQIAEIVAALRGETAEAVLARSDAEAEKIYGPLPW